MLLRLRVECYGFSRSDGDFLKFIVECFVQRQLVCQVWVHVKQESKHTYGGEPKSIKFQVYMFLIEPAEEHVRQSFIELDVSDGTVAVDHASDSYGVLEQLFRRSWVNFKECLKCFFFKWKLVILRVIKGVLIECCNMKHLVMCAHGHKKVIYVHYYVERGTGFRGVVKSDMNGRFVFVLPRWILLCIRTSFRVSVRGLNECESIRIHFFFCHGDVGFHWLLHVDST